MNPATLIVLEGSPEAHRLLWSGRVEQSGEVQIALPEAVAPGAGGREIRFRLRAPGELQRPAGAAVWWQAIRAFSLTATATPCLAVLLYGLLQGWPCRGALATLSGLGAVILQLSVNLWNDAEDHVRLIDLPGSLGGSGVLQRGWLSARAVRQAAVELLVAGLALGVPALLREPALAVVGVLALVGVAGYSGWPFSLKYRALGDLAVALLCGPVLTVGFSLAAFGRLDLAVVGMGLLLGLCAVGLLHVNNLQDVEVDRARGAITLAAQFGDRGSRIYLAAVYAAAFAAWILAWARSALPLVALVIPLLTAIPVARFVRAWAADPRSPAMAMARIRAGQLHLVVGVALCAGLGLSWWR